MNAVDTNVLIYSIDAGDDGKRRRALDLIESLPATETLIPWQVACEVAAVIRTMGALGRFRGDYAQTVTALRSCFPIAIPQHSTLERSLRIQVVHQVSPWDALLLAACADAGITRLYTEDMQGRPEIERVKLVDPFADE